MERKNEANNEKSAKQNITEGSSKLNSENKNKTVNSSEEKNEAEFDNIETPIENHRPGLMDDSRNWNSSSGTPRGDRNRIIKNSPFDSMDDIDELFDDEDDVL